MKMDLSKPTLCRRLTYTTDSNNFNATSPLHRFHIKMKLPLVVEDNDFRRATRGRR